MRRGTEEIPGYSYGLAEVARSPVSVEQLAELKVSAGFTEEDERYLRLAGQVLGDQVEQVVHHWRNDIIASIPSLARHSRTPEGEAIPAYLERSNARFCQWILDSRRVSSILRHPAWEFTDLLPLTFRRTEPAC